MIVGKAALRLPFMRRAEACPPYKPHFWGFFLFLRDQTHPFFGL